MSEIDYLIGIDPGVNTGVAVMHLGTGQLCLVGTFKIHQAINVVEDWIWGPPGTVVIVEDARMRGGKKAAAQGAGSVKRDSKIWEDYLTDYDIPFLMIHPAAAAKGKNMDDATFRKITGYDEKGRISQHARDAAMMIFGWNRRMLELALKEKETIKATKTHKK